VIALNSLGERKKTYISFRRRLAARPRRLASSAATPRCVTPCRPAQGPAGCPHPSRTAPLRRELHEVPPMLSSMMTRYRLIHKFRQVSLAPSIFRLLECAVSKRHLNATGSFPGGPSGCRHTENKGLAQPVIQQNRSLSASRSSDEDKFPIRSPHPVCSFYLLVSICRTEHSSDWSTADSCAPVSTSAPHGRGHSPQRKQRIERGYLTAPNNNTTATRFLAVSLRRECCAAFPAA